MLKIMNLWIVLSRGSNAIAQNLAFFLIYGRKSTIRVPVLSDARNQKPLARTRTSATTNAEKDRIASSIRSFSP